jgi:hypothetical protein
MKININPLFILKSLLFLIIVLFIMNLIGIYVGFSNHDLTIKKIIKLFDFDTESNFPTYYSSITSLISAYLLFFISIYNKKNNLPYLLWFFLSLSFFYLSADEFIQLHEKVDITLRKEFSLSGTLYYAWIIPYGIFAIACAVIYYFKFLIALPKKIMWLFIISGFIFIVGAIGFEFLAALFRSPDDKINLIIQILYTMEELFEMIGIAIFIYTLLLYIKTEITNIIEIKKPQ